MSVVTTDDKLAPQFDGAKSILEVRDQRGKLLGFFAPTEIAEQIKEFRFASQISLDEYRERRDRPQAGYTTDQVREHLRRLEQQHGEVV